MDEDRPSAPWWGGLIVFVAGMVCVTAIIVTAIYRVTTC